MCFRPDRVRLSPLLSALLLSACITACGKMGPPLAPLTYFPAQTEDLSVQQLGNQLLLTMSYPTTTTSGLALEGIEGLRIYLASLSLARSPLFCTLGRNDPSSSPLSFCANQASVRPE